MPTVIVPNSLRDAIYAKLDEILKETPEGIPDREFFYQQLLDYFYEHGVIPDFFLSKKDKL